MEVKLNQLVYSLDDEKKVAAVISNDNASGNIYIPKSIKHNNQEYIVTSILKWSFKNSKTIRSINFPPDSKIKSIDDESFAYSNLESLVIPSFLSELKECWCSHTTALTKVVIMPNNQNFMWINNQMIVGKSDKDNSDYDVLIFVSRDVEEIVIPSFIKTIGPYAFSETKIKAVLIPPKLIQICEGE